MYPAPLETLEPEKLKIATKTSLPQPKRRIAFLLLMWLAHDGPSRLTYCEAAQEDSPAIRFSDDVVDRLVDLANSSFGPELEGQVRTAIKTDKFLEPQMEFLRQAFRFVWRMADFEFTEKRALGAERTDQKRFPKTIRFGSAMDSFALALADRHGMNELLFSTAFPEVYGNVSVDPELAAKLWAWVTLQSEPAFFQVSVDGAALRFNQAGIYLAITADEPVSIAADKTGEVTGPLRVMRAAWKDGINPYISASGDTLKLKGIEQERLFDYSNRVLLDQQMTADVILARKQAELVASGESVEDLESPGDTEREKRMTGGSNRIVVGAPGTGKSYQLDKDAIAMQAIVVRTVFHSSLTFGQFFGSLRPSSDNAGQIGYSFIPGPLVEAIQTALLNPVAPVVLLIEEINRADASSAFGQAFQLLDRGSDGTSVYEIAPGQECDRHLAVAVGPRYEPGKLRFPSNLHIWATLNPADQGVAPLDSAFLRRWSREFLGINHGEQAVQERLLVLDQLSVSVNWNKLRRALNETCLLLDPLLPEDRLIGPFFLTAAELEADTHDTIFVDKILNYVFDEVLKYHRDGFFNDASIRTFSDVQEKYVKGGPISNWLEDSDAIAERDKAAVL